MPKIIKKFVNYESIVWLLILYLWINTICFVIAQGANKSLATSAVLFVNKNDIKYICRYYLMGEEFLVQSSYKEKVIRVGNGNYIINQKLKNVKTLQ